MIKAYCKRVLLFLPYVLCYFLALGIAMLALVMYASEFLFENNTDSIVSVACYVPDDESYNQLGIALVQRMDSVKHTIDINQVSSEKKVVRLVEDGDAIAGIIVPEGFIENMGTPEARHVSVIYRDADTFEEHIVNDLLYAMSDLLGTAQASILSAAEYADNMGIGSSEIYEIRGDVQSKSFSYVMDRKALFHKIDADDIVAKYAIRERLTASYTLYILMMSVFVISFFYKGNNRSGKTVRHKDMEDLPDRVRLCCRHDLSALHSCIHLSLLYFRIHEDTVPYHGNPHDPDNRASRNGPLLYREEPCRSIIYHLRRRHAHDVSGRRPHPDRLHVALLPERRSL